MQSLPRRFQSYSFGKTCFRNCKVKQNALGIKYTKVLIPKRQFYNNDLPRTSSSVRSIVPMKFDDEKEVSKKNYHTELKLAVAALVMVPFIQTGLCDTNTTAALTSLAYGNSPLPNCLNYALNDCITLGPVSMGLPGITCQLQGLVPLEVIPTIKEEGVGKLPILPYLSIAINGTIWSTYGFLLSNISIWAPMSIPGILGYYYCYVYYKKCPADADWLPGTPTQTMIGAGLMLSTVFGCATLLPMELSVQILGILGNITCVCMFGGPLSAIREVIQTKSTKYLPFGYTCISFLNSGAWTLFGISLLDPYLAFPCVLGLFSSTVQLGLFARYGFHSEEPKQKEVTVGNRSQIPSSLVLLDPQLVPGSPNSRFEEQLEILEGLSISHTQMEKRGITIFQAKTLRPQNTRQPKHSN